MMECRGVCVDEDVRLLSGFRLVYSESSITCEGWFGTGLLINSYLKVEAVCEVYETYLTWCQ